MKSLRKYYTELSDLSCVSFLSKDPANKLNNESLIRLMMRDGHKRKSKIFVAYGKQQICELPKAFQLALISFIEKEFLYINRQLLILKSVGASPLTLVGT